MYVCIYIISRFFLANKIEIEIEIVWIKLIKKKPFYLSPKSMMLTELFHLKSLKLPLSGAYLSIFSKLLQFSAVGQGAVHLQQDDSLYRVVNYLGLTDPIRSHLNMISVHYYYYYCYCYYCYYYCYYYYY